jgi:hypothetical protein
VSKTFDAIDSALREWLAQQPMFFVATAPSDGGHLNVSPKGLDGTFTVIDDRHVAYLDLTGSGIETVAHLRDDGRIVLMFCAFSGPPRIVRLHGRGVALIAGTAEFEELAPRFSLHAGARSVISVSVTRISDSCGFGVPLMDLVGQRPTLPAWAERKTPEGMAGYRATRNRSSIEGLPGLLAASGGPGSGFAGG